jgi:hypothetical protein
VSSSKGCSAKILAATVLKGLERQMAKKKPGCQKQPSLVKQASLFTTLPEPRGMNSYKLITIY